MSTFIQYPNVTPQSVPTVPNAASLPAAGDYDGQIYLTTDTYSLYAWSSTNSTWELLNSSSTVTGMGANGKLAVWSGTSSLTISSASGIASLLSGALNTTADGSANQIFGMNAAANDYQYYSLAGTANQVTVTISSTEFTLSLPQDIDSAATPEFAGMTLTGFSGALSASGGVLSAGTLSIANGGTGQTSASSAFNALSPMTSLGDTIYGGAGGSGTRLAGNTTTTKKFLCQTGTGAASAAPVWTTIGSSDLPAINLASLGNGGVTGTLPYSSGGTGLTSIGSPYNLLGVASSGSSLSYLAIGGTTNQINISASGSSITFALPQNINTGATPQFAGLTLTGFNGAISASGGVLSAGTLSVLNGGTGQGSALNANGVIYAASTSAMASASVGTAGQVFASNGSGSAPTMQTLPGNTTALKAPTVQTFTSTGATVGYVFFLSSSANATSGATYTNNGNTYTVLGTISGLTTLYTSGSNAPLASGTLTKSSGTGDSSITYSGVQAIATYSVPSNPTPLYLNVKLVGAGGAGGGSGTGAGAGSAGTNSVFGINLLQANGGSGSGNFGTGGTGTISSVINLLPLANVNGGSGSVGFVVTAAGIGGAGGNSAYAGAGGATNSTTAKNAAGNSGSGGGGAGGPTSTSGGTGGGAGAFLEAIIHNPATTYVYAIGVGGTGGAAGTSGGQGGNGGNGYLVVEEHYQ